MKKVSIIVPCYNEEESIPLFYKEIKNVFSKINYKLELIFIEDGSKDKTLELIRNLSKEDKEVNFISLSRNFGKEAAMWAGFKHATGDFVTVMDCDLQDPPSLIPEMLRLIEEESYDVVGTRRVTRKGEPPIRSLFARMFYKIINKMSKIEMVDGARDFRMMTRQVVDNLLTLKEYNRYSKGLFSFVGFKTKWLEYENIERVAGETKWSFWKLFKYAIEGIVAFTTVPLTMITFAGVIFSLSAFVMLIIIIVKAIKGAVITNLLALLTALFGVAGITLLCLGVVAFYLAKAYLEIKDRPIYIIKETNME